jgi:mono/diheme cytochrome c family protein
MNRVNSSALTRVVQACLIACFAMLGCGASDEQRAYEYMPDMARSPAYKAYSPNPVTRDGLTLQRPVMGTIARGDRPLHYGPGEQEAARAGRELKSPIRSTQVALSDGKALFQSYCLVCHGAEGKGDGPIASKIPPPPSYVSPRLLGFQPGRIFHVITFGSGKMPSHASQLSADERWKVVAYVHTKLQGLGDVSSAQEQPNEAKQ